MKFYQNQTVYDAALDRIRFLFAEFENIVLCFSGGKDSTVVLNLSLQVAAELGRLPLPVLFLDQEAEWDTVIEYIRAVMADPRVKPVWLQIPLRIFNSTSTIEEWLYCWDEEKRDIWIREKEEIALKENIYGTDRFAELFGAYMAVTYPEQKACMIGGVRAEESPARFLGLTGDCTYKWVTWGKIRDREHEQFDFYPLYDWELGDVWKAIHDHKWPYCKIYDYMYQHGVPVQQMRVSNVHHETAIDKLFYLQEVESDMWSRLTRRIAGISTAGQLGADDFFYRGDLPYMFESWREYRDHLLKNLVQPERQERFRNEFANMENHFYKGHFKFENIDRMFKAHIQTILTNDYHFTKLKSFYISNRNRVGRPGNVAAQPQSQEEL